MTSARRSTASRGNSQRRVVLLVDDDPQIRSLLRRALERRSGIDVREAGSALGARTILELEHVDVICSDYDMPGMNGQALLAEVGRRWPACKRLMLSGFSTAEMVAESDYIVLRKPVSVRAVADTLVRLARSP